MMGQQQTFEFYWRHLMALGKKMLLLAAFCGLAWGQTPGLTTIQDELFKADGTLYNGTLVIQWSTFDVTNVGTIVQQSTSVAVVNGNLLVQLAPNATAQPPANIYTVHYESDGREQFAETWVVPVSTLPLTVAAVRVGTQAASSGGTGTGSSGSQTTITESGVVGLVADLAQRPQKGVGFGTNAVAYVDDNGLIETSAGDPGDCVFVDGTTGPCGQPTYADAETPGGIVDGTNNTFTLAYTPLGSSLMLFRNGLYMTPNFDYVLTAQTFQFATGATPQPGDTLTGSYRVDTSAGGNIAPLTSPGGAVIHTLAAQVICSGAGTSTSATAWTSLGGCDVPAGGLLPGDRIEVQFTFAHTGTTSGFTLQLNWGNTTILARNANAQDTAVVGRADAAITATGAQLSIESWGTVLPFLPAILNAPAQSGLEVVFRAALSTVGPDSITLTNYTVLRYPGT
jgi:hypothetical protein